MPKQAKTTKPNNYAKSIRWFAAEFLVVLSGVLVAVALGNYFKAQDTEANSRQYLTDLLEELKHNQEEVELNLEVERAGVRGAKLLMLHIDTAEQTNPDSIRSWIGACMNSTINFRPAMGIAKTMITLGSINSLKDLKLRAAIINYEQEATELADFFNQATTIEFRQAEKLIDVGHVNRFLVNNKNQKRMNFEDLRGNEQYTKLFLMSYVLYSNRILIYEGYLAEIKSLKLLIEKYLEIKPVNAPEK